MITTKDISEFLIEHLENSANTEDIAKIMKTLEIDSAWVYLGGSGARQQIFQLRNNVRVVFQFDGDDNLVAYGVYESEETLENDRKNFKIYPVSGPDVLLNYVNRE